MTVWPSPGPRRSTSWWPIWASWPPGCVAVPLNPNSPAAELARELEVVTPVALLAGGAGARGAADVSDALSFTPLVVLARRRTAARAGERSDGWRGGRVLGGDVDIDGRHRDGYRQRPAGDRA